MEAPFAGAQRGGRFGPGVGRHGVCPFEIRKLSDIGDKKSQCRGAWNFHVSARVNSDRWPDNEVEIMRRVAIPTGIILLSPGASNPRKGNESLALAKGRVLKDME